MSMWKIFLNQLLLTICMISSSTAVFAFQLGGFKPNEAFPGIHGKLVQAAVDGDAGEMEKLVKQGADPNYKGVQGSTPLVWAISAHNHRGIEKLLELGADPNSVLTMHGRLTSATWIAAAGSDYETLRIMLEQGGDANKAYDCKTPLMAVIGSADYKRINLLLAHGADINNEICNDSAPEIATDIGRFDLVIYLLSKGYKKNLERLAKSANNRFAPKGSKAYEDKLHVLNILRQQGVAIPPPKQ